MTPAQKIVQSQLKANIRAPIPPAMLSTRILAIEDRLDDKGGGASLASAPADVQALDDIRDQLNDLLGMISDLDERVKSAEAKLEAKPKRQARKPKAEATDDTPAKLENDDGETETA